MIFSSYWFIFVFLPVTFGGYFLLNRYAPKLSGYFLVLASLVFFAINSGWFVVVFAGSVLFNYGIARLLQRTPASRKSARLVLLWVGLGENLGLLAYYKYSNFFLKTVNALFASEIPLLQVVLPIGISFFTFQIIAFLVDCYRDKAENYTFVEYLLFITLFFQLIIGPITRHKAIIPQFRDPANAAINPENLQRGLFVFSLGLGQKVLLADQLIPFSRGLFNSETPLSPAISAVALLANLFAYYFDFAGYTNMAIGLARCFNIILPENLNSPLKARNFQDYWQRRHITLTKFFTEFVFRHVYNPSRGLISFVFATMVTFLVSGLWHGAGWHFVLWGLLQGVLVSLAAVAAVCTTRRYLMPKLAAQFLTVVGLMLMGGLFAANNIGHYLSLIKNLVRFSYYTHSGLSAAWSEMVVFGTKNAYVLLIVGVCFWIAFFAQNAAALADKCASKPWYPLLAGLIFMLSLFMLGETSTFLYFRF